MRACTNHQKALTTQRAKAQRAQKAADKLTEAAQSSTASPRDVQAASKAVEKARAATASIDLPRRISGKQAKVSSMGLPVDAPTAALMASYRTESHSHEMRFAITTH